MEQQHMHKDVEQIKKDIAFIKNILAEDFALSEDAESKLAKARKTPRAEYLSQDEVKKKILK